MCRREKKSLILVFLSLADNSRHSVCSICERKASHGGLNVKAYDTSNHIKHVNTVSFQGFILAFSLADVAEGVRVSHG